MVIENVFDPQIVLDGARIVAVRIDDDLIVREVAGDWCPVAVGTDVRDTVPALYGLEAELTEDDPNIDLPFVTPDVENPVPVSITALRADAAIWVLIRDVSLEAATQTRLVQQHNALIIAQRELSAARDAALAADRAKTAFLANISHELRTPLNVIIGGGSILRKPRKQPLPPDETAAFAQDILDAGELLLRLVNDLIDLSRAETGNMILYEEWCSLSAIAGDIIRLAQALPDAEGIIIKLTADPLPEFYADPTRLKQILLNLLSNAVKACHAGNTITVGIRRNGESDLLMVVQDDGPGMDKSELTVAMEPFGQPNSATRAQGAGLGLAIVRRLAELHDGRFSIETRPGAGLTATVRLPCNRFAGANPA